MSTTKAIPVVAAKVAATLADFPVYIKPSAMTGWGSLTTAEANSIRFYSDSGLTTELAREVVSADEIHVLVPSLTTTTTIYADYDGIRADYAATDTYGRNAVWSGVGYGFVTHLEADGTDSSGNLTATNSGVTFATGQIESGAVFNAGADKISYNTTSLISGTANFTLSLWIKYTSGLFIIQRRTSNSINWQLVYNSGSLYWQPNSASNVFFGVVSLTSVWTKIDITRNVNSYTMYKDGVSVATGTSAVSIGTGQSLSIGDANQNLSISMQGEQDEVRIVSGTAQTANWITTEYNNQSDVATFWGTVTDAGGATANNSARRMLLMGM